MTVGNNSLRCSYCQTDTLGEVKDSRPTKVEVRDGVFQPAIRRRRECSECKRRTSTIELPMPLVCEDRHNATLNLNGLPGRNNAKIEAIIAKLQELLIE